MLASLLPGLRDVRTPITIGYLWLLIAWLMFADRFPTTRPEDDGLIARLYELSNFIGNASVLAAVSFTAYVLGAMITIPVEGKFARLLLRVADLPIIGYDYRQGFEEVLGFQRQLLRTYTAKASPMTTADEIPEPQVVEPELLRPRLLASGKTEVYGEYDRLVAEAAFRLNIALPILVLGLIASIQLHWAWIVLALVPPAVMFVQGCHRVAQSWTTINRAAVARVFTHPFEETLLAQYGALEKQADVTSGVADG